MASSIPLFGKIGDGAGLWHILSCLNVVSGTFRSRGSNTRHHADGRILNALPLLHSLAIFFFFSSLQPFGLHRLPRDLNGKLWPRGGWRTGAKKQIRNDGVATASRQANLISTAPYVCIRK